MRKCLIPWKSLTRLAEYGYSTDALNNECFKDNTFFGGGGGKIVKFEL